MDLMCDERPSDSPYIEKVWRSQNEHPNTFISIAQPLWGMVVTKQQNTLTLTVRGPEIRATPAVSPPNAEFFGIMFKAGTLMPIFPPRMVMDRCDVNLPEASSRRFWLNGASWQFPDFDNAETFVERLVHDGLLLNDSVVDAVLQGEIVETSLRTVQRRFLHATGLSQGALWQIERARNATNLLKQGVSILDTVDQAGYSDQPHMTRSLKQYIGLTPAQIINENRSEALSFLFKT